MLLRRMIAHVKSQNWLAVFLDFIIVVVGVFIGIQLGNWNEARNDDQRKAHALDALQTEYELNIDALTSQIHNHTQRNKREALVSQAVSTGTLPEEDRESFDLGLAQIMFFGAVPVRSSVYSALEQSGDLALIDDRGILIALNDFNSSIVWTESQRESFRNGMSDLRHGWRDHVFHMPTDNPRVTAVTYDFNALTTDRAAVSDLVSVVRMKHIFAGYLDPLRVKAITVCELLAESTGRPCRRPSEAGQDR